MMEKEELERFTANMFKWLLSSEICSKYGAVYSWANDKKPGYVYPEIIGYYIKLLSYAYKIKKDKRFLNSALRSADYLSSHLSKNGAVGRDNTDYAFDSAICFSGLIALGKVTELNKSHEAALKRLMDFVYSSIHKRKVAFKHGKNIVDLDRWSLSYGSLMIKNSIALIEAYDYFDDKKYKELAESMSRELVGLTFRTDHFSINGERKFVYTHPHCYATEGLIFLASRGYNEFLPIVYESAGWLARNQNEDGSLFNWYLRENISRDRQGDATAQAARIWLLTDKKKFDNNIRKATSFLKNLQSDSGGLHYNIGSKGDLSEDINSWVTMFAAQAVLWQTNKPDKEWIV